MTNRTVAERIAESIWNRLREARRWGVRLGEETLTDLLVLDFLMSTPSHNIRFIPTIKPKEAVQGTDLVVYVRRGANKADIYAVQAKRLYERNYNCLNARSGSSNGHQINILEDYARALRAIPLYLLFNHVDDKDSDSAWQCCQTIDKRQFGCTLVPSWRIRDAISTRGCRTFKYIHSDLAALPWRCAFACPNNLTAWDQIRVKAKESRHERFSPNLPSSDGAKLGAARDRQTVLPDSSLSYDQYEGVNFSSGVGEWPSDSWNSGTSSLSMRDLGLLYRGVTAESDDAGLRYQVAPPRRIMLVNSDDS